MNDLDLSAAVKVGINAAWPGLPAAIPWEEAKRRAASAVTAAAPLIEAQVRAQVAAEIEANLAEHPARGQDFDDGYQFASEVAASIARGESA